MKIRPPTDEEFDSLPHVILTSDKEWDPSILDNTIDEGDDDCFDPTEDIVESSFEFDAYGEYKHTTVDQAYFFDTEENIVDEPQGLIEAVALQINRREFHKQEPDYETLRPYFALAHIDTIKRTFNCTTQYARTLYLK